MTTRQTSTISDVRTVWNRREQIGTNRALKKIVSIINDAGVKAGQNGLMWKYFMGYVGLTTAFILVDSFVPLGPLGGLIKTVVLVVAFVGYPFAGAVMYWDFHGAEGRLRSWIGNAIAVLAVVLGPFMIFAYYAFTFTFAVLYIYLLKKMKKV